MNTPTYKEQFDKITRAYFENKLKPCVACACFIGNMLNNTDKWAFKRGLAKWPMAKFRPYKPNSYDPEYSFYTMEEICDMENIFLEKIGNETEESIFLAMDSTLDMLRRIHESRGEVIESFEFKKRELQPA